jgi:glycosyltransferase involved in cell wall biosynthesis
MKITHFISSPASGGAEVYVKDLSIAMVKLGHAVHILFLSNASDIGRDCLYEEKFLTDLTNNGVEYSFIGNKVRKNPFLGIIQLRKHIKNFKPNILHCHLYYALIFSLFTKTTKVIYTHHSINPSIIFPKLFYRMLNLKVSAYVGICNACTNMLKTITSNSVVKIDNAVSINRIKKKDYKSEAHDSSREINVLMIGRLTQQKNYDMILDVVDLLKGLKFVVNIAGEGPEFNLLKENVIASNLSGKVNLIGNVSNIPDLINDADIFAMTSKWEGLPISLIEATLSGLPTIVTNVGGCAEISHECVNGFVMDDFSPVEYARKLRLLIESMTLRRSLGENALNFSGNYELTMAASKHLTLYQEVI